MVPALEPISRSSPPAADIISCRGGRSALVSRRTTLQTRCGLAPPALARCGMAKSHQANDGLTVASGGSAGHTFPSKVPGSYIETTRPPTIGPARLPGGTACSGPPKKHLRQFFGRLHESIIISLSCGGRIASATVLSVRSGRKKSGHSRLYQCPNGLLIVPPRRISCRNEPRQKV
jgi:hypothetical protein